jgi:hypothetical protein
MRRFGHGESVARLRCVDWSRALLDDVRQLVGQQMTASRGRRVERPLGEHDVASGRVGGGVQGTGRAAGLGAGMYPHVVEGRPEGVLHVSSHRSVERATRGGHGGVDRGAKTRAGVGGHGRGRGRRSPLQRHPREWIGVQTGAGGLSPGVSPSGGAALRSFRVFFEKGFERFQSRTNRLVVGRRPHNSGPGPPGECPNGHPKVQAWELAPHSFTKGCGTSPSTTNSPPQPLDGSVPGPGHRPACGERQLRPCSRRLPRRS